MHVLWLRIPALGLILAATPHAQTLRDMLWQRATPCYSRFENVDGDGEVDAMRLVDDAANGYVQLAGDWPTCGCGCSTTVGAFRQADGGYTLLQTEQWNCSWQKRIVRVIHIV